MSLSVEHLKLLLATHYLLRDTDCYFRGHECAAMNACIPALEQRLRELTGEVPTGKRAAPQPLRRDAAK